MLTLDRITQRADEDGVDADVVERDYVLTHVVASMAMHPDSDIVQFKGGTSLPLCYFPDYRYSADIDINVAPDATDHRVDQLLNEVLATTRERVALPYLGVEPGPPLRIEFIGPKQTKRPRSIKLDISDDELSTSEDSRAELLHRYEDQIETPPMRVYSLDETAAEKLRSIMQRLQCRDLYDTWHLVERAGVDAAEIRLDFEAKTRHRGLDPADFRADSKPASMNTVDAGKENSLPTWPWFPTSIVSSAKPRGTSDRLAISSRVGLRTRSFQIGTTPHTIPPVAKPDLPQEILEEIRREYPPILTTAHVAEMMHSTIGDVRDKVHRGELPAVRWGQQFRFFREEVLAAMTRFQPGEAAPSEDEPESAEHA